MDHLVHLRNANLNQQGYHEEKITTGREAVSSSTKNLALIEDVKSVLPVFQNFQDHKEFLCSN